MSTVPVGAVPDSTVPVGTEVVPALRLQDVGLTRDGRDLLDGVSWTVEAGSDWVVLGANGSGKTSLVRIAALYDHPTRGTVEVLGEQLGATDVRALRRRVGLVSHAMSDLVRPRLTATEVVMCAKFAALEPWWHQYDDEDRDRARSLLAARGVGALADRAFGSLSSGERQRVLLARTLMAGPGLVLLDEPSAGLDPGGREELLDTLEEIAADPTAPPVVLVTHHVEEVPPSFSHVLALRDGRVLGRGALGETLSSELVSECFGRPFEVSQHGGRWSARRP
ncbi:MAG: ABC transporter ATP-binding protein [Actinomycetes bacterium]